MLSTYPIAGAIREQHRPYDYSTTCVLDGGRFDSRFTRLVLGTDRDWSSFGKPGPKPQGRGHHNPRGRWLATSTGRLPRGVR